MTDFSNRSMTHQFFFGINHRPSFWRRRRRRFRSSSATSRVGLVPTRPVVNLFKRSSFSMYNLLLAEAANRQRWLIVIRKKCNIKIMAFKAISSLESNHQNYQYKENQIEGHFYSIKAKKLLSIDKLGSCSIQDQEKSRI